jgi:3-oxoacyl-(acyl-carrier-protein) synthase
MKRRVVVTGMGVVSSIGQNRVSFWENLLKGEPSYSAPCSFSVDSYKAKTTTVVDYEKLLSGIGIQIPVSNDDGTICAIMGYCAAIEALHHASLLPDAFHTAGLSMGTTSGGTYDRKTFSPDLDVNQWLKKQMETMLPSDAHQIAMLLKLEGPVTTFSSACTSGLVSIGHGYEIIRSGDRDIMVAGGADHLQEQAFAGFNSLRIVSKDICRPFDKNRKGLIIGDGAAMVVLEDYNHAKKRGAPLFCEITGAGMSCDAFHVTAPSSHGALTAMEKAIESAGISPGEINYVNCHGTGTAANDNAEMKALHEMFSSSPGDVTINSTKAILGHLLGTAGSIEFIISALSLVHNTIPPAIHITEPEPAVGSMVNMNRVVKKRIHNVLTNAFGFGGNNISMVLSRVKED